MPVSNCENCPLVTKSSTHPPWVCNPVKFTRGAQNEIVVVGQSPARVEVQRGEAFVGESGQLLRDVMRTVGILPGDVSLMNSLMCPEGIPGLTGKKLSTALKTCRPNLETAINRIQPRLIVALGAHALKTLLNKGNVMQNHGKLFWSEEFGCNVMAMIHPAAVMRGAVPDYPHIPIENMNPIEKMFYRDWQKVASLRRHDFNPEEVPSVQGSRAIDTSGYRLIGKEEKDLYAFLESFRRYSGPISLDIETTGLVTHSGSRILSVAFCKEAGQVGVIVGEKSALETTFFTLIQEEVIRQICTLPNIKLVAGRPFDEMFLRYRMGVTVHGPVVDVLTLAHLKDETYYAYNLEAIASMYADMHDIKDFAEGHRTSLESVPVETLVKYNAVDADATFRVFNSLRDIYDTKYYQKFMQPIQNTLTTTAIHYPCQIDREILSQNQNQVDALLRQFEERFLSRVNPELYLKHEEKGLSLTRSSFLRDVIFSPEGFGIQPNPLYMTEVTKEPQMTEEHLKDRLQVRLIPPEAREAIETLLEWKKLHKIRTSYLNTILEDAAEYPALPTPDELEEEQDGLVLGQEGRMTQILMSLARTNTAFAMGLFRGETRIYPTTSMNRTVTGRGVILSPPIQTYPARGPYAGYIRSVFKPEPGFVFMSYDLSQSELRIMGWLSRDRKIMKALKDNVDLHLLTAAEINGVPPERVTKEMRDLAKGINFGLIYGMAPMKFQIYLKENYNIDLPYSRCVTIHDNFFRTYTGIAKYHQTQKEIVRNQGWVMSPLGRIRHLPGVFSSDKKERSEAERQAINSPIQSFSSDLGLISEMLLLKEYPPIWGNPPLVRPMWFIHDAVVMQVENTHIKEAYKVIKEVVEVKTTKYIEENFQVKVDYPVKCDVKVGESWSSMVSYHAWISKDGDENCLIV